MGKHTASETHLNLGKSLALVLNPEVKSLYR